VEAKELKQKYWQCDDQWKQKQINLTHKEI